MIITDSIGKHVSKVKNTHLQALPGYTIARTIDAIAFGNIGVSEYEAILVHMGTNDIPPKKDRFTGKITTQPIKQVVDLYNQLISTIRRFNPQCYIVVSGIIPRPVDFAVSHYRVTQVNQGLQSLCEAKQKLIFNPTQKFFIKHGQPVVTYYSESDRLHLRGSGVIRLQQAFQQALSDINLRKGNHWRRSRPMVQGSRFAGGSKKPPSHLQ